ncbi:uncharacterized protein LOC133731984 isoform X1 [Rosa rugosa]|uniref:uncharacterized protein LOC133731984 isoform X1 n=1 Tax=Rosa rugosa TaxID=74645 RepID=UPI002B401358|nr:uncharacterized protein LOC133731984 isoform X1 [Rosa rugosa]
MAADYEPPSFSLGLDFGFESELQTAPPPDSSPPRPVDTDVVREIEPPRELKRLKRGLPEKREPPTTPFWSIEDDIEEFSSPEDTIRADVQRSTQYQTSCSSSKVPLRGSGVLSSQSSNHSIRRKRNHISDVPASVSLEASRKEFVFPKLTTSPLRRFQLIDSDSDDPSVSHSVSRVTSKVDSSSKKQHTNPGHSATTSGTNKNASTSMPEDVDLWKNFSPIKKFNIPTPALDEVCQEYFQSVKDKSTQNLERDAYLHTKENFHETTPSGQDVEQLWNVADPLPPAHHYFFHDDPKIRKLVCSRLLNFSPLGAVSVSGNQQTGASVIDYMGQFSNGEASKRTVNWRQNSSNISNVEEVLHGSGNWVNPKGKATQKGSVKRSANKRRNKSVKSNTGNMEHASGNWVEPRISASKKRIQANAQSSGEWYTPSQSGQASGQAGGHWYTGPGGRKVYVSKTGQELTGQTAYRLYSKESGKRAVKARKGKAKK